MNLSFHDAFGAGSAPGAPAGVPPAVLAGEGGPADGRDADASFGALLDAAGSDAVGDAPASSRRDAADAALAAALHAAWWLTTPGVQEPAAGTSGTSIGTADVEGEGGSEPALDPDDNAAAEWFIASGAVLTNLVVIDEVPVASAAPAGSPGEGVGDASLLNTESSEFAGASGAWREAAQGGATATGADPASMAADGRRAGETAANTAGAPGAEAAAASDGLDAAQRDIFGTTTGETSVDGALGLAAAGVSDQKAAGAARSTATSPASVPPDARKSAEPTAGAEAQAAIDERRHAAAAARLMGSIERGGGAQSAASAGEAGNSVQNQAAADAAAAAADAAFDAEWVSGASGAGDSSFDSGTDDQGSNPGDRPTGGDAPVSAAPARTASATTFNGTYLVTPTHTAAPAASASAVTVSGGTQPGASAMPGPDTLPQLVQAMRLQYRAGGGDAVVRLNPEHLGAVSISLRVDRGMVSATVHAESSEVRQWLEGEEASLREGLSALGLHLDRFVVHRDGRQQEQRPDAEQQHRRRAPRRQAGQEQATFEIRV